MYDVVEVQCPWCFERMEISIEMDEWGEMILDCQVCCRPWRLVVHRDQDGDPVLDLDRAD